MTKGVLPVSVLVLVAGGVSVVLGILIGLNRAAEIIKGPEPAPAVIPADTSKNSPAVELVSGKSTLAVGENVSVELRLSAGDKPLRGAGVVVSFDPKKINVVDVSPGSLFASPVVLEKKIDKAAGTITLTIGSFTPVSGQGPFAVLQLTPVSIGATTLAFRKTADSMAVVANSNGQAVDLAGLDNSLQLTIVSR